MVKITTLNETDVVIDLRDVVADTDRAYSREHVVQWLRTSGGSLGERAMKHAAAEFIEASQ
jgi:hypothetical protein